MAIGVEAIKGAGMTYQGSTSTAEVREVAHDKVNRTESIEVSNKIAEATTALDVKQASADGTSTGAETNENIPKNTDVMNRQIKDAIDEINKRAFNSEAIFGIHDGTNRVTIKIIDKTTREVIKELPPEKTLDMIEKVWEMAGIMVDEKR